LLDEHEVLTLLLFESRWRLIIDFNKHM